MANVNFFKDAFGKAKQKLEGFLYREDVAADVAPVTYEDRYPDVADPAFSQPQTVAYQNQPLNYVAYAAQQPAQQPPVYNYGNPQPAYQPQQPAYQPQPAQQPVYQAPAQPQAAAFQPTTTRNRRVDRTPAENKVLDFAAYQQPAAEQDAAPANAWNARIINARGMGDCRSAITLLRSGDTVLIVLENINDPAEMRRLVDTLSGACYSLTATITKVSRYGVYLLAPQAVAVYADQTTNQMNSAPVRSQMRSSQIAYSAAAAQPPYAGAMQQPQRSAYQQNPYYAPQQDAFTQRTAAPEESAQPFYARPTPQAGQMPAFSTQPAGYGYAPDDHAAAAEV